MDTDEHVTNESVTKYDWMSTGRSNLSLFILLFIYPAVHDYLFTIYFPIHGLIRTHFWVELRITNPVYRKGWECDFSRGERASGGREKEKEQLPGSGRSWHHHLWAPRVALGARQSQAVPRRLTAIQPEQTHHTLHHPKDRP